MIALRLGTDETCYKDRVAESIALIAYLSPEQVSQACRDHSAEDRLAAFLFELVDSALTVTLLLNGGRILNKAILLVCHL